jgi:hypothetical protein
MYADPERQKAFRREYFQTKTKQLRADRKAQGICRCGRGECLPSRAYCLQCKAYEPVIRKRKIARRREMGLCLRCGSRPQEKDVTCDRCKVKDRLKRTAERRQVLDHYGTMCACCGEKQAQFLCIDHVNNDGNVHRKTLQTNNIYRWLLRNDFPVGFQVLCFNCNMAKAIYGKCPHQAAPSPPGTRS